MKRKAKILLRVLVFIQLPFLLASCCKQNSNGTTTCSFTFSDISCSNNVNVTGYVVFGTGTSTVAGAGIVIQWSIDDFVSSVNTAIFISNAQGFPVVPFSFNFGFCTPNQTIQLRAFQSSGGGSSWTLGDAVGRYDGTSTGNATYLSVTSTASFPISIVLDGSGAQ